MRNTEAARSPKNALVRRARDAAVPTLAGMMLFLAVGAVRRSSAEPSLSPLLEEPAKPCDQAHGSRGESAAADLDGISQAYAALRRSLTLGIERSTIDPGKALDHSFDLGLPVCPGKSSRTVPLQDPVPQAYRGAKLLFLRGEAGSWPPEALKLARDPRTEVLLVSIPKLRDLGERSERLGRRVSLAPPRLVQVLGLRCVNTVVTFSEKGDEALLSEGD